MLMRSLLLAVALAAAVPARALEYTDVYYNPAEAGWGMFLVQSDATQFVALFIYGSDNKPTWYTATLKQDSAGNYTGQLIATTGTNFALPWNPGQLTVNAVGTMSFKPTDLYHATVTYSLTGGPSVTKTVERQTLTDRNLAGNYSGAGSGVQSACPNPQDNDAHQRNTFDLVVTQSAGSATITATFTNDEDKGLVCTIQGPLTLFGRLYRMVDAQLTCMIPGISASSVVTVESLHPTGQGIEFRVVGKNPGGCNISLSLAAVLNN